MIAEVLLKSLTYDATKPDRKRHLQILLTLDVPKLFELPLSDGPQACMWLHRFEDGWTKYIQDKQLQVASQECLSTFLVSILSMVYSTGMPNTCYVQLCL